MRLFRSLDPDLMMCASKGMSSSVSRVSASLSLAPDTHIPERERLVHNCNITRGDGQVMGKWLGLLRSLYYS